MDKVYLADDTKTVRLYLQNILSIAGYDVELFENGKQLFDKLQGSKPDLIITDVNMPVMDGFELVNSIRSFKQFDHIPIIMMTQLEVELKSKIKGFEAGATEYITPPIHKHELLAKTKTMIKIKHLYDEIQKKEEKFRTIFESAGCLIILTDKNRKIIDFNKVAAKFLQIERNEMIGCNLDNFIHPEYIDAVKSSVKEVQKNKSINNEESIFIRKDRSNVDVMMNISKIGSNGHSESIVFMINDITLHKQVEQTIRDMNKILEKKIAEKTAELQEANEHLKKELKDKTFLVQEVHHRTMNNMQTIIGLLRMQTSIESNDEKLTNILKISQSRIRIMAKTYELIFSGKNISEISLTDYIRKITSYARRGFDISNNIVIEYDLKDIHVDLKKLNKLGLVINEIISNSLQHAFVGKSEGKIVVALDEDEESLIVKISDNGIGLSNDVDVHSSQTLGFRLMNMLIDEFHGKLKVIRNSGTAFEISIAKSYL